MAYKDFLKKIGLFQAKHPYFTLLIILLITIALYGGVADVRTVASLEKMMPTKITEIKAFNTLRDNYLGQDMIAIVLSLDEKSTSPNSIFDIRDKEVMLVAEQLQEALANEPDILEVYAAPDVLRYATGTSSQFLSNEAYNELLKNPQVQAQLQNFINDDATTMIILATTDISADDTRMQVLASQVKSLVETSAKPSGIKISVTGTPVIQQKLGELIGQDRKSTQNISTLFVFIIIMLLFGTFTSSLVPLTVVLLSVNWLYGIMGYANLPISTLAGGVAAMVIGIGIDYAIHLMNKFKNERKNGKSVEDAIVLAIQNTGTALTGAAIATILAFLAFTIGSMPEMNRFGLLMAIGVSSAFILSIVALPALLIVEERLIHFISKKMHFGVEGEYRLYREDEVHPDEYERATPSLADLKSLQKKYKIVKKK